MSLESLQASPHTGGTNMNVLFMLLIYPLIKTNIVFDAFRSLITDVWNMIQDNAVKYLGNTLTLPLIVR